MTTMEEESLEGKTYTQLNVRIEPAIKTRLRMLAAIRDMGVAPLTEQIFGAYLDACEVTGELPTQMARRNDIDDTSQSYIRTER